MDSENFILIEHYCEQTQTPIDFIDDLLEYEIERIYRLHRDLGINMEGIDSLNYMIEKVNRLERELKLLRNRLTIYEH
ncbi:unnamed protein product [Bathycoccus prasinos]